MDNEFTIFLKQTNAPPYVIRKCASWLFTLGHSKSFVDSYNYLIWAETHKPASFRYLISEYYRTHQFVTGYLVSVHDDANDFRSHAGNYGEELHMYARRASNLY